MAGWKDNEFAIGINMAGAVSAGAYTAGVLDFLTEALEEWQKQKDAFRAHLSDPDAPAAYDFPVPLHDVIIEGFSGASAGGMCAAIASVMLQSQFVHIKNAEDPAVTGTNNIFYESWVNKIDISRLLQAEDLKKPPKWDPKDPCAPPGAQDPNAKPLLQSLLDSTVIDEIAAYALTPRQPAVSRPWVASDMNLFLTVTNMRGMTYPLYGDATGSVTEFTTYYGDRVRFETTRTGAGQVWAAAQALPLEDAASPAWKTLQETAKATGAFPLFLAPRVLARPLRDYRSPVWFPVGAPDPVPLPTPDLPDPPPDPICTLNVDGGVTDNDPFELIHDYLACQNPNPEKDADGTPRNPREPEKANCAVITVAPFPATDRYDENFFAKPMSLLAMAARLFTVLIAQSRFLGESLSVLTSMSAFSRFVIAPSDDQLEAKIKNDSSLAGTSVLQCGTLSAFGGFMCRDFRAHDFMLGRYNCQWFLKTHFKLPLNNPVIEAGQTEAGRYAGAVASSYAGAPPPDPTRSANDQPPNTSGVKWMPIIPLCGTAAYPYNKTSPSNGERVDPPVRKPIKRDRVQQIAGMVLNRVAAIKGPLLDGLPLGKLLSPILGAACALGVGKSELVETMISALRPDVE